MHFSTVKVFNQRFQSVNLTTTTAFNKNTELTITITTYYYNIINIILCIPRRMSIIM